MNILPDDEQAGSPVSLGPDSQRPASLDVASAWRDTVPVFNFNHTGEPACKTEPSSTCHDGGDSAHLESALNHRTSSTGAGSIRNVEQLLHEIGAGIDSQDFHLQFSDIPSMPIYGNSLEQALRDATKRSPRDNGNKFIPIGNFDGIITKENVRREIQSWLPEDRNLEIWTKAVWDTFSYSDPVTKRNAFTSRKKIFAILVLFNAQARIASFIRGGLWDKDLPFEQTNENRWVSRPNGISGKACTIESLNWLKGLDADNFDIYQWHMLPPIFNMAEDKVIFYDLHPRIPLPFTDLESGQNRDLVGGQGEVFRVKIDESHYILDKSAKDQVSLVLVDRGTG
ncbi:hypothetical protein F4776DRAFT_569969 [Hypoxylon sp. NC0597]|nr:hypothetical protein F4776DRAFT_569969 [Hypoxylon sp. NC0597]